MPLHLLGKKSWNVYNKDNIAQVRRDEARAQLQAEEEEKQEQAKDAERRIDILRGKLPLSSAYATDEKEKQRGETKHRRRRKLAGENDTDRDIRFAKEDAQQQSQGSRNVPARHSPDDAPIVDKAGHISLFPEKRPSHKPRSDKNPEAEAELARKNRELEDQYTMRFSNAAGYKEQLKSTPWYSSTVELLAHGPKLPSKDVWGNEDPRRQEREKIRLSTNDPLAMMKKGVRQLRDVERERIKWAEEKERELRSLKEEDKDYRRRRRRKRRNSHSSPDSLNDFSLDAEPEKTSRKRDRNHPQVQESKAEGSRRDERHRSYRSTKHGYRREADSKSVFGAQFREEQYSAGT